MIGARPLKRLIQKYLQDALAEQIVLAGAVHNGETVTSGLGPLGLMLGDVTVTRERRPAGVALNRAGTAYGPPEDVTTGV